VHPPELKTSQRHTNLIGGGRLGTPLHGCGGTSRSYLHHVAPE
jgi:hypothetical protein